MRWRTRGRVKTWILGTVLAAVLVGAASRRLLGSFTVRLAAGSPGLAYVTFGPNGRVEGFTEVTLVAGSVRVERVESRYDADGLIQQHSSVRYWTIR